MNLSVASLIHPLSQPSPLTNSNTGMLAENLLQASPSIAVESSLSTAELSPIYEKAFHACSPQKGKIPLSTLRSLLALDGLSPATNHQILVCCVNPGVNLVSRDTFNLVLALTALAQKNLEYSPQNVLLHLNDLPVPSFLGLDSFNVSGSITGGSHSSTSTLRGNSSTNTTRSSLSLINDPWHVTAPEELAQIAAPLEMTLCGERVFKGNSITGLKSAPRPATFGLEQGPPLDVITIQSHDQIKGYIFKHLSYVVTSERFSSRVLRRYSEFHALYKYFLGKYQYRLIPDIPPKKLGGNEEFLEKRRKGLYRFMNFLCNHPLLSNDAYLKVFLSETKLSNNNIPDKISSQASNEIDFNIDLLVKENSNTDYLLQDVPSNLELQLDNLYIKLKPILTHFNAMINVVDKISRRASADAADLAELSHNNSSSLSGYDGENDSSPSDSHFPDEQFPFIMIYLQKLGVIMSNNSDALDANVVETLKCLRDVAQGMNSLLSRSLKRPLVDEDRINRRIKNNNITINFMRKELVPDFKEIEKLKASNEDDRKKLIYNQMSERLVRRTLWSEYQLYRDYQVRTTVQLLQGLVNDQVNFCNLSVYNWKALADQLALLS